ncbi:MAG TPA: ABC transporter permease [Leptolinea sp.]
MINLKNMIWIEWRKAIHSRIPLWTTLGSLFLPMAIAFLIFISRNPGIAQKLGLVSTKANLIAYSATDWPLYLALAGQIISAAGFFLFVIIISWVFGREFSDGTVKDMLAVPVPRSTILLAKFIISTVWSAVMTLIILFLSLVMGAIIKLPPSSTEVILAGSANVLITACLVMAVVFPFALLASVGRGYLLPLGLAVFLLIMANVFAVAGWGEIFPWCIPGLFAQNKTPLSPLSFWIVILTGMAGLMTTYFWWKKADQNR